MRHTIIAALFVALTVGLTAQKKDPKKPSTPEKKGSGCRLRSRPVFADWIGRTC